MSFNTHAYSHLLSPYRSSLFKYQFWDSLSYIEELELSIYKSEDHKIERLIVLNAYWLTDLFLIKLELMGLLLPLFLYLYGATSYYLIFIIHINSFFNLVWSSLGTFGEAGFSPGSHHLLGNAFLIYHGHAGETQQFLLVLTIRRGRESCQGVGLLRSWGGKAAIKGMYSWWWGRGGCLLKLKLLINKLITVSSMHSLDLPVSSVI